MYLALVKDVFCCYDLFNCIYGELEKSVFDLSLCLSVRGISQSYITCILIFIVYLEKFRHYLASMVFMQ